MDTGVLSRLAGSCWANLVSSRSSSPRHIARWTHTAESGHEPCSPRVASKSWSTWGARRAKAAHAAPLTKRLLSGVCHKSYLKYRSAATSAMRFCNASPAAPSRHAGTFSFSCVLWKAFDVRMAPSISRLRDNGCARWARPRRPISCVRRSWMMLRAAWLNPRIKRWRNASSGYERICGCIVPTFCAKSHCLVMPLAEMAAIFLAKLADSGDTVDRPAFLNSSFIQSGVAPGWRGSPRIAAYFMTSSGLSESRGLALRFIVFMNRTMASTLSISLWRLRSNCSTFSA